MDASVVKAAILTTDAVAALKKAIRKKKKLGVEFAEEYIVDLNGTQAAIRAGYAKSGAAVQASRLLTDTNISTYVRHLAALRTTNAGVTADRVIKEFAKIAFSDVADLVEFDGDSVTVRSLDAIKNSGVIKKLKLNEIKGPEGAKVGHVAEIEMWDKMGALNGLGRYFKLFTDNVDVTSNGEKVEASRTIININHRMPGDLIDRDANKANE